MQRYCAEEGQCVDNAECSERTGTCECNEGFYHDNNGRCVQRVEAGELFFSSSSSSSSSYHSSLFMG